MHVHIPAPRQCCELWQKRPQAPLWLSRASRASRDDRIGDCSRILFSICLGVVLNPGRVRDKMRDFELTKDLPVFDFVLSVTNCSGCFNSEPKRKLWAKRDQNSEGRPRKRCVSWKTPHSAAISGSDGRV